MRRRYGRNEQADAMDQVKIMKRNEKPDETRGQTKSVRGPGRLAFWLLTLAVLMLGLGTRPVFAAGTISCSGTAQTVTLSMPPPATAAAPLARDAGGP